MNKKLKIKKGWKTFCFYMFHPKWYLCIPLGIIYMFLGSDMQNRMWYDGWWALGGVIIFIAGFTMWSLCFGIHTIIFVVNKIDAYIRDTVRDEMKGEPNK